MPDKLRQANARAAATRYAPKPDGSTLTYGLIGVSLLALALALYGGFYHVDMLVAPIPLVLAGLGAFCFGAAFRFRLKRRHTAAYDAEYAVRQPAPTEVVATVNASTQTNAGNPP